jgi:glutaminase
VSWAVRAQSHAATGKLPEYIPLLGKANPNWFAVHIYREDGQTFALGEVRRSIALMSVIKPFLLLFLLQHLGEAAVFDRVGREPSDQSFHSLAQLMADCGFPRNPMINSGAIVLASLLPGADGPTRCAALQDWLNQQAGSRLVLDRDMLESVRSLRNEANVALAKLLAQSGHLNVIESVLDTYNHICCLSGTVVDLARLGLLLARPQPQIVPSHQRAVNALMLTCGLYEASGYYAVRIGLPIKSGVSGALLAVVPREGAIACYSPTLDTTGNPVAGLMLLEQLTQDLDLSVFSSR